MNWTVSVESVRIGIIVCPCKFPIIVTRDGIQFLGIPLEVFVENDLIQIPSIKEVVDEKGHWVEVVWKDDIHEDVKEYEVVGHIVYAGCPAENLQCDSKSIYKVKHPKEEWDKYHIVNI